MRIGICARTWGEGGGIGVYTRNLLEAMLAIDRSHQYVLFFDSKTPLGHFSHYKNVKAVYVPSPSKWLWDQMAIPWYAAKEKVDILLHPKLAVPLLARCKTVMVLHGTERFVYPQFSHKSDILFFKTIYPSFLQRATAIISVSENARRDIIHFLGIDPAKVKTIHLAAAKCFKKIEDLSFLESVRQKYGLPQRFILNVGLIYPGKNIPNLLKAFKLVREQEDINLVIAGTGRRMYKDDLNLIHDLQLEREILLPGYIPQQDLVAVYNLAQLFVFPSFYESFGLVSLEAMACGCPVVVSRTGGAPEAAGDAAVYVDPLNTEEIATAVIRVLRDSALRQSLIESGFENTRRFAWTRTAYQTLDVLELLGMS